MKKEFVQRMFTALNGSYSYCVLRNYQELPDDCASRDIDILLTWSELKRLKPELREIAADTGCGVLYENWDNQLWTIVYADNEANVFQLDFQCNFAWLGLDLLDEAEVLRHRGFNGKVWHADALYEFLSKYLYCRILGGKYPEKYAGVREKALAESGSELEAFLQQLSRGKGGLSYWDKSGKWCLRMQSWMSLLCRRPIRATWRMVCFVVIYVWQLLRRRGWMIGFSGPDGCGKTTVIELVVERLAVNPPHLFHFRPELFPNLGELGHKAGLKKEVDRDYHIPHRAKRCGIISSMARLAYYLSDYLLGYCLKIMPLRQRKAIVFFDRYYTDIAVDSERSSIFLPFKFLCRLRHLIPGCQKYFLIRVKPETILERKQELTKEDMDIIYARLEYFATHEKRCVWIDNNGTPEEAAKQIILALRQPINA